MEDYGHRKVSEAGWGLSDQGQRSPAGYQIGLLFFFLFFLTRPPPICFSDGSRFIEETPPSFYSEHQLSRVSSNAAPWGSALSRSFPQWVFVCLCVCGFRLFWSEARRRCRLCVGAAAFPSDSFFLEKIELQIERRRKRESVWNCYIIKDGRRASTLQWSRSIQFPPTHRLSCQSSRYIRFKRAKMTETTL